MGGMGQEGGKGAGQALGSREVGGGECEEWLLDGEDWRAKDPGATGAHPQTPGTIPLWQKSTGLGTCPQPAALGRVGCPWLPSGLCPSY